MKQCIAYIRVSTARQGEKGVSLQEQRDAIERYVKRENLKVVKWFEERETAAKRGRPVFGEMLRLLRKGAVYGVVMHKIDRSARNLKDWADLGELLDSGVEVCFANESLDLRSRGGRLSADIQAVIAADYIRNLREETKKGFYGRLKQGIYPLAAPLGYLDCGGGKAKAIDPVKGPLVKKAFELYATGRYNLHTLAAELQRSGLTKKSGRPLTLANLSYILNNPFYFGLIKLRSSGETFLGAHPPLISKPLFDMVQAILRGKTNTRAHKHDFLFRRLLTCKHCGFSLIAEHQKGHTYYRCHTRSCPTTCIREEVVLGEVFSRLHPLSFSGEETAYLDGKLARLSENWKSERARTEEAIGGALTGVKIRLSRLLDGYLDGTIEKELYLERKEALLTEEQELEERRGAIMGRGEGGEEERVRWFLEQADSLYIRFILATTEEKRSLLRFATSNRVVDQKNVAVELSPPLSWIAQRTELSWCAPHRNTPRSESSLPEPATSVDMLDHLLAQLILWIQEHPAQEERIV